MGDTKKYRLKKVATELGIGVSTVIEYLTSLGQKDLNVNSKISEELYQKVQQKFNKSKKLKEKVDELREKEEELEKKTLSVEDFEDKDIVEEDIEIIHELEEDLKKKEEEEKQKEEKDNKKEEKSAKKPVLEGPKVVGKIDLKEKKKKEEENKTEDTTDTNKKRPKAENKKEKPEIEKTNPEKKEEKIKKQEEKIEKIQETEEKQQPVEEKKKEEKEITKEKTKIEKTEDDKKTETKIPEINEKEPKKEEKDTKKAPEVIDKKQEKTDKNEEIKTAETTETIEENKNEEDLTTEKQPKKIETKIPKIEGPKVIGKVDLDKMNMKTRPDKKSKKEKAEERKKREEKRKEEKKKHLKNKKDRKPRVEKVDINNASEYKKRKSKKKRKKDKEVNIISNAEVQKQLKETLKKFEQKNTSKLKKAKKLEKKEKLIKKQEAEEREKAILKVTEFMTVKELASLMDIPANEAIEFFWNLDQPVTINSRLSKELIELITEEYNFQIEFVSSSIEEEIEEILNSEENRKEPRPPIVTVMGHVDHGKTSLLDYIRKTNVAAKEAGGITQHIGAYSVSLADNKRITFIDTPGHEAFTTMRARGASITDIAVIVVSAVDSVMPQTDEAIDHAKAAGVPIVFAINKIDKPGADPERIRQQLAERNILVESWGGNYGDVEISAKTGQGIDELLERIWLEAELLELKANPDRNAIAVVLEARLDKGRGYVTNIIVRTGTLHVGDVIVAGAHYGKVKAMHNELNQKLKEAGPSMPVQLLGLNGAAEPGDPLLVVENEKIAREKANKRAQILHEMQMQAKQKFSLEEISRRLAEGEKLDLNFIIKADVKGSIDALVNKITEFSNDEVSVNVVRAAVGQISESDVMLAAASKAIIIGFNVRPSSTARKTAEDKDVEIRLYSVIYDLLNDVEATVKGMLKPELKEEILGSAEVMQTFKVSKVGTIAGCLVRDGKIVQNAKVRLIRDGIVIYEGKLNSLKRFKNDVKEVQKGYECGMSIENFNDIKVGDFIEAYEVKEVERE